MVYGSSPRHWPHLAKLARDTNCHFVPSVGPGYVDTSVRPWNGQATRRRRGGQYYEAMWEAALSSNGNKEPPVGVSVTSFNEWHEGTQIEPAMDTKQTGVRRGQPLAPSSLLLSPSSSSTSSSSSSSSGGGGGMGVGSGSAPSSSLRGGGSGAGSSSSSPLISTSAYEDYGSLGPEGYLDLTAKWSRRLADMKKNKKVKST